MYPNFSFNGIRKDYVGIMEKSRPYWATRSREILTVPNRPGGYLSDTRIDVLTIQVRLLVDAESPHTLRKTAEDLANWFNVDVPAPLIFDDEPGRTYYAVVDGELNPDETVSYGFVDVKFICPDPHKYGALRTETFDQAIKTVVNQGSAEALPIFRGEVLQNITNVDIVTLDAYMRIGAPANVTQTPIDPQTKVVDDQMGTLDGWSQASSVDNGHVAGSMTSDGNGFLASTWGPVMTPEGMQGPSLIRGTGSSLQDFTAEIDVEQLNDTDTVGMIEIYFRDVSGNVVCKLGIEDMWWQSAMNRAKFQLGEIGNRVDFARTSDNPRHWNDFKGVLRVTRKGQMFTAYIAKKDSSGNHHTRSHIKYFDSHNNYQNPVTSVQVSIRKWPDSTVEPTQMKVTRLQLWRMNDTTPAEPVYIAGPGDQLEINHETGDITINGEPRLWLKDFGSTFFSLKPGENVVSLSPAYAINMDMSWRERFL